MKPLLAKNQVRLGPARALQLAISGMRHRPLRSGVTVVVFTLAVAFLAHMASYSLIRHSIQTTALAELASDREKGEFLTRLGSADSATVVRQHLATGDAARLDELQRFSGASPEEIATARRAALVLHQLSRTLDRLPPAQQAGILADQTASDLVEHLHEPGALDSFADRVGRTGARLGDTNLDDLRSVLEEAVPVLNQVVERAVEGHSRAVDRLAAHFEGRRLLAVVAAPPSDFPDVVRAAGFDFSAVDSEALTTFAEERSDLEQIGSMLLEPETRARVAREARIPVGDVSLQTMSRLVRNERRARWLATILKDSGSNLDGPRIAVLFAAHRHRARLTAAVADVSSDGSERGLPTRTGLLILLSFLVCSVGVANAMLMSVTERFTEIATMKCLGGLDSFIMGMFVIEAMIQGAVGGLVGGLLGLVLAGLRGVVEFGPLVSYASASLGSVLLAVTAAALVGIALAAVAAIGPAWVAARLSPMEAMRVE